MSSPIFIAVLLLIIFILALILLRQHRRLRLLERLHRSLRHHTGLQPSSNSTADADVQLIRHLHHQLDDARQMSETFKKFVPNQFFDHFAKQGSGEIKIGHADEDEVAIMFCDIRGFSALSEIMSPQELMNFLNSYFERMDDPIHANGGFIDKFIGDAIMALFDHPGGKAKHKASDAITAAIAMRHALVVYNQHRSNCKYPPVNIGIGVHFGPAILGTVGSKDRMDSTVIGDSVNIAFRLEGLTSLYGCDIIVSAQALQASGLQSNIQHRLLDWVRVKGKQQAIEVYEILEHLSEPEKIAKAATDATIRKGLQLRQEQKWDEAIEVFQQILNQSEFSEPAIKLHLEHCYKLRGSTMPADWDGALSI